MAKIYGLFGSMTGKLADTVMSVRNGEQIARKYQPIVYNPSTPAQVATRAKLKLMSQLSAIMAPVIAIPRQGSVSARNLFVKKNYSNVETTDLVSDINLSAVTLTDSVVALGSITATRGGAGTISLALTSGNENVSRVVYAVFFKAGDEIRFHDSVVATVAGVNNTYEAEVSNPSNAEIYVYAYGVRDNTDRAKAIFGDITSPTGEDVARLIVERRLSLTDITLTETSFVEIAASRDIDPDTKTAKKK